MKETILITGCSSGIGRLCAEQLHEAGYTVVASCRKPEDVATLQQQGLNCIQLDLDDTDSIHQGIETCLAITGGAYRCIIQQRCLWPAWCPRRLTYSGLAAAI